MIRDQEEHTREVNGGYAFELEPTLISVAKCTSYFGVKGSLSLLLASAEVT